MQERLLTILLHVRGLFEREEGQAAVEYGVLVALIIALCIGVIKVIGVDVSGAFQSVVSAL